MKDNSISRWLGLIGLLALVTIFIGFGPLSGSAPGENAAGSSVVSFYRNHSNQTWLAIYLVGVGLALLVVYASALRIVLKKGMEEQALLPSVAFGGGIILVAGFFAGGMIHVSLLLASHNHQASIAQTLNFIDQNDSLPILFGASLMTIATGLCIIGHKAFPTWLGWISILVGLALVAGPVSMIGLIAFGVWLPVTGFVLGRKAVGTGTSNS